MRIDRTAEVIAVIMVAAVLIGEVVAYTSDTSGFSVAASYSDGYVQYSVSSDGSQPFSVIVMEDGMRPMTELYIYHDEGRASSYYAEQGPVGSRPLDQRYYVEQLVASFAYASGLKVTLLSAEELLTAMEGDIAGGTTAKGLIVLSGALPDTVYSGDTDDIILKWIDGGGRLYWAGNVLGRYISTANGIEEAGDGYQALFFGVDGCLNSDAEDDGVLLDDVEDNSFRYDLSLKNNRSKYGVDMTMFDDGSMAVGYSDGTYASIALVKHGEGMICVLAGDYSRNQLSDMVNIVSSGISYSSKVVGTATGSVKHGTSSGTVDIRDQAVGAVPGNLSAYIYLGGYLMVYGRLIVL